MAVVSFDRILKRGFAPLVVALSLLPDAASAGAGAFVETVSLKTFPFSKPDPVPATEEVRYPYSRYEGYSDVGEERPWQTVVLENDRIRVCVLPQVGGRVWSATDKVTGHDFIRGGHELRFRDGAARGPCVRGGIEYDFGVLGRAPSASTPVDWTVRTNSDCSVSCFVSASEWVGRTVWQVEIRLGEDADAFEARTSWFNASGLPVSLCRGTTAAYSLADKPEFIIPDSGTSANDGFYAVWWPEIGFGGVHRPLGCERPCCAARKEMFSDNGGQCVEVRSGILSPASPVFAPGATVRFAESWGPLRNRESIVADVAAPLPRARPAEMPQTFDWSSARGRCVRGIRCLRERRDREGARELRLALAKDATQTCAFGALAGYEMRRGNYDEVHALARKALAIDAYDAEANYMDGFAAFVEGDQATARERLGTAALSPNFRSAALALVARGYLREKRKGEALDAAKRALAANPDNLDALLVEIIADRGNVALRAAVLERFPLFHGAIYEVEGSSMWRLVKNEFPSETYLDLASWYAESGLQEDATDLLTSLGDSILAKIRLGDYAGAKRLSVSGVFPFRREDLPALQKAVATDGHWKFCYLLAVLSAYFDYDEQADGLLNGCGDDPDEAVFYLYRASRRTDSARLADLRRAQELRERK